MEPQKQVEQFEVIERQIITGRRPISRADAENYIPTSEFRTSGETYVATGQEADRIFRDETDRRYNLTGERDVSRDPSFAHRAGSPFQEQILSPVNNYGYDEQVINTSEGGARVIQTHGSGRVWDSPLSKNTSGSLLMRDRSLETSLRHGDALEPSTRLFSSSSPVPLHHTSGAGDSFAHSSPRQLPHSILKTSGDSRNFGYAEEGSLTRKDSYKRMQESQGDNLSYAVGFKISALTSLQPSSNATMITKNSGNRKWNFGEKVSGRGGFCLAFRSWLSEIVEEIRNHDITPSLICGLLLILLFLLFIFILLIIFLRSAFAPYSGHSFLMFPPRCDECVKRNPALSAYRPPSKVFVHVSSPSEIDFELVGNLPFKSNSFAAVDFSSGYVAYADHALTNEHGRHTTCFLMELDRKALPSHEVTMDALSNTYYEVHTEFGWQEYWQYITEPIDANRAQTYFHNNVKDCVGAQWYMLKHTVHPRDESCYDCYDFCLPDYAIQRTHKYEDDYTLGIRRLNCFRHYVAEWNNFAVKTDEEGGHWGYPKRPIDTQRNEYGEWVNWTPVRVVGQPANNMFNRRRKRITHQ